MGSFNIAEGQKKTQEKAVLVGVFTSRPTNEENPLEELESLAKTVDVEVVGRMVQRRHKFHPTTYIGRGKMQEVKELTENLEATLIICNDHLSPGQAKKLEDNIGVRILDRTELILDIFAMQAKTKEAKLQVELAQMEYILPRLRRMWTHLESQQGGVGFRGPGEKQLETDKQIIKKRIADCSSAIKKIQERKEREVQARKKNFFTIGLVGYTNAGKSSLMNYLTGAEVLVEDRLFATLDTKTKLWEITSGRKVLLSDTVGFIDKLPHHLVASFKATLEEAAQADILLHVVDISHPEAEKHIEVVYRVLKSMGIVESPMLLVFNKLDLVKDPLVLENLKAKYPKHVCVSVKTEAGMEDFKKTALEMVEDSMVEVDASFSTTDGKLIAWLSEYGRVIEKKFVEQQILMKVHLSERNAQWLQQQPGVKCNY